MINIKKLTSGMKGVIGRLREVLENCFSPSKAKGSGGSICFEGSLEISFGPRHVQPALPEFAVSS